MVPEITVVAAVVAPAVNPVVSSTNGEPQFPKSDGPMPAAAEPELAEESSSFPEQYVLLAAIPTAEKEAELDEKAASAPAFSAPESWETKLVEQAAQRQAKHYPSKTSAQLVDELLAKLRAEKADRLSRNLNHWSEHAPRFLEQVIAASRQAYLQRRRDARVLLRTRHAKIIRVLESITRDREAAEAIAADTYKELIEGRTTGGTFFNAAIMNARNYLESQSNEQGKTVPLDNSLFDASCEDSEGSDDALTFEPTSQTVEDQDPLEILIHREERQEADAMVLAGMRDSRWRYIKRLDWAKELAVAFRPLVEKEASLALTPV
jgi:hypothetical protein